MARNFKVDDTSVTELIRKNQGSVVLEDNVVLAAQQQNVLRNPERRLVNLDIDRGGSNARKLIERICSQQHAAERLGTGAAEAAHGD